MVSDDLAVDERFESETLGAESKGFAQGEGGAEWGAGGAFDVVGCGALLLVLLDVVGFFVGGGGGGGGVWGSVGCGGVFLSCGALLKCLDILR